MTDDRTIGELARLIDAQTHSIDALRTEVAALNARIEATYLPREVANLRFLAVERDVKQMKAGEEQREQAQATNRRMAILAVFTALVCPVVVAIIVSAMQQ